MTPSTASLHAAAGDLYEALKALVKRAEGWESDELDRARAALAKAEGEASS